MIAETGATWYNKRKENNRVTARALASPSYIGGEVVRMSFDFKDLMAFGMFVLALLTFISNNRK